MEKPYLSQACLISSWSALKEVQNRLLAAPRSSFPASQVLPWWQGPLSPSVSLVEQGQRHSCPAAREQGWPRGAARPSVFCQWIYELLVFAFRREHERKMWLGNISAAARALL